MLLKNLKILQKRAGAYPMTPDGIPIIGTTDSIKGYVNAIGMCGQGFMLGPGVGQLISQIITNKLTETDKEVLQDFSLNRGFSHPETLK